MEVFIDQKLEGMELATQHIVMSRDLNQHGFLFGGQMLAWIDEGCAMFVMEKNTLFEHSNRKYGRRRI